MFRTRYVHATCSACGMMVRIMGESSAPDRCPECDWPLITAIRGVRTKNGSVASEATGPRSAFVRLFAVRV